MAFVTYACLASFSDDGLPQFSMPNLDKLVHFVFYFVAAILGMLSAREQLGASFSLVKTVLLVITGIVIYGMIIEVLQDVLTSDREGDIMDVLANSLGAFCGVWLIKSLFSGNGRLKWKN